MRVVHNKCGKVVQATMTGSACREPSPRETAKQYADRVTSTTC
jgi:hypothetical protein